MSTNIKLSESQISKIIQSDGSFSSWFGNLGKKAKTNLAIPLSRDKLLGLVSNLTSNAINKLERKKNAKVDVRTQKWFSWCIGNEGVNDIIKIIKRFGCIIWLNQWNSKTWNKKTKKRISWGFFSTSSCFNSVAINFFNSESYKWKRI